MKKYIIFTDIDGTLYDSKNNCIPQSSLDTLNELNRKGHKIFMCTGRPYPDIHPDYFKLPVEGFILSCGAHILMRSNTIYSNPIPYNILKKMLDFLIDHKIGFSLDGRDRNYLFDDALDVFRKFECRNMGVPFTTNEKADELLAEHNMFPYDKCSESDLKQILKISIYTNNTNDLLEFMNQLPNSMHGYIEKTKSVQYFAEITLKENTKASGIDKVLSLLNESLDNTIAIGDGLNDLDMLRKANIGIAMGNACNELKEIADFITKDIQDDGFKYAFEYFKLL